MASHEHSDDVVYRIPDDRDSSWSTMWKIPAALGAVGLLGSLVGFMSDPVRFGYAYLFAFFAVLTLVFGAMFLVIALHITQGHWALTLRRVAEVIMGGAPVMALLFVPLAAGVFTGTFTMYDEWMHVSHEVHSGHGHGHAEEGDHGGDHADHAEGETHGAVGGLLEGVAHADDHGHAAEEGHSAHTPQETYAHHKLLTAKVNGWLNHKVWITRAIVYLIIWLLIAWFFFTRSTEQDESKDKQLTLKMKSAGPVAATLFGTTMTFAAFDWVMALEPTWYSTIFGVVIFGGSAVAILALLIIIGISLKQSGLVGNAINTEHFHDLAKLMFGFMCFWAYTSFSQWMLIWYAGIPEESTWFQKRWDGNWEWWSLMLMFGHFVIPFFFLISRLVKRNIGMLRVGAIGLLCMHVADIYWYVMPQAGPLQLNFIDIMCLMMVGGIFFTYVFLMMKRFPLIPIGDPRLARALHHHQSH